MVLCCEKRLFLSLEVEKCGRGLTALTARPANWPHDTLSTISVPLMSTKSMPVDWTTASIPAYDELPHFRNFPGCAWGVWGAEDQLGTVNLLTDSLVKRSAAEEIQFVV